MAVRVLELLGSVTDPLILAPPYQVSSGKMGSEWRWQGVEHGYIYYYYYSTSRRCFFSFGDGVAASKIPTKMMDIKYVIVFVQRK